MILGESVKEGQKVIMPKGDWPEFTYQATLYNQDSYIGGIEHYDYFVLHKGMVASFSQNCIKYFLNNIPVIFANEVFVVFSSKAIGGNSDYEDHVSSLYSYVYPERFYRFDKKRCCFIHIPKTGGTSVWSYVSNNIRSSIYFSSDQSLANFEGDINQFEAVGGHILAETLLEKGWNGPVFYVLRNPVDRIRSFISHAMREGENITALSGSFTQARDLQEGVLSEEQKNLLFMEGNQQVRALGADRDHDLARPYHLSKALMKALAHFDQEGWDFAIQEDSCNISKIASIKFGIPDKSPIFLNSSSNTSLENANRVMDFVSQFVEDYDNLCMDIPLYKLARGIYDRKLKDVAS